MRLFGKVLQSYFITFTEKQITYHVQFTLGFSDCNLHKRSIKLPFLQKKPILIKPWIIFNFLPIFSPRLYFENIVIFGEKKITRLLDRFTYNELFKQICLTPRVKPGMKLRLSTGLAYYTQNKTISIRNSETDMSHSVSHHNTADRFCRVTIQSARNKIFCLFECSTSFLDRCISYHRGIQIMCSWEG